MKKREFNKGFDSVINQKALPIKGIKKSLFSGTISFVLLFTLTIITKLFSISLSESAFKLGIFDFTISLWGFIIFSFITFSRENNLQRK